MATEKAKSSHGYHSKKALQTSQPRRSSRISERSKRAQSLLMNLPTEIRLMIWEYLLIRGECEDHCFPTSSLFPSWNEEFACLRRVQKAHKTPSNGMFQIFPKKPNCGYDRCCGHVTVAILRVSKQCYGEGLPILYTRNTFHVAANRKTNRAFSGRRLQRLLPSPYRTIKNLSLEVYPEFKFNIRDLSMLKYVAPVLAGDFFVVERKRSRLDDVLAGIVRYLPGLRKLSFCNVHFCHPDNCGQSRFGLLRIGSYLANRHELLSKLYYEKVMINSRLKFLANSDTTIVCSEKVIVCAHRLKEDSWTLTLDSSRVESMSDSQLADPDWNVHDFALKSKATDFGKKIIGLGIQN